MSSQKGHGWLLRVLVITVLALAFLAGHAIMLRDASSHMMLPNAALASVIIIFAVVIHLGLLGTLFALFRRRFF